MPQHYQVPKLDRELVIDGGIRLPEIHHFLNKRLEKPAVLRPEGARVYNFNNHGFDGTALMNWADEADNGVYVTPYQLSSVWSYMVEVLPDQLSGARFLAYSTAREEYWEVPNYRRVATSNQIASNKGKLTRKLREQLTTAAEED